MLDVLDLHKCAYDSLSSCGRVSVGSFVCLRTCTLTVFLRASV